MINIGYIFAVIGEYCNFLADYDDYLPLIDLACSINLNFRFILNL
jgi:hypothetical protein